LFSEILNVVIILFLAQVLALLYWLNIYLQRECEALKTMNNEMKIRLQAMEQQAQLKDGMFMPARATPPPPQPKKKSFTVVSMLACVFS